MTLDPKALLEAFRVNHHHDAEPSSVELANLSKSIEAYLAALSKEVQASSEAVGNEGALWWTVYDALDLSPELRQECTHDVVEALKRATPQPLPATNRGALEYALHKMWEYGFSENDLQPIRAALSVPAPGTGGAVKGAIEALKLVRGIIVEGAVTGFNWASGDWAERLYASQQDTHKALAELEALSPSTPVGEGKQP